MNNKLYNQSNNELNKVKKELLNQSIIGFLMSVLLVIPFLLWQGKDEYMSNFYLLVLTGISSVIANYSLGFYFVLYISKNEKRIMISTIYSGIFTIIVSLVFIYLFGLLGAGISTILGVFSLYFFRKKEAKIVRL